MDEDSRSSKPSKPSLPDEGTRVISVKSDGGVDAYRPGTEPRQRESWLGNILKRLRPSRSRDDAGGVQGKGEPANPNANPINPPEDRVRIFKPEDLNE